MGLLNYCDYYFSIGYDSTVPDNQKLALQNILVTDPSGLSVVYLDPLLHYLDDTAGCEGWLNSLGIGTFSVTYSANVWSVQSIFNPNIWTEIRLVMDKNGTPITSSYPVTQQNCHWAFDPSIIRGCMDTTALNYNPLATESDGSCYYEAVTDIDRWKQCIINKRITYLENLRKGEEPCCNEIKLWSLNKALEIIEKYVPEGAVIVPGVPITAEVNASASIDFLFLNSYGYFSMELFINGQLIATIPDGYYSDLTVLVQDIKDYIDANPPAPIAYTASNVGTVLTITAPAGYGASLNGVIMLADGHQIYFDDIGHITTTMPCTKGGYDPVKNEIWFGTYTSNVCLVFASGVQTGSVDAFGQTQEVVYNPNNAVKYVCQPNISRVYRIDNLNTPFPPHLTTDVGCGYGVYNGYNGYKQLGFSSFNTDIVNIFDATTDIELGFSPIALPPGSGSAGICAHPISGIYYVCCLITSEIRVIDPGTGAQSSFPSIIPPNYGCWVENSNNLGAGTYQLWVAGLTGQVAVYTSAGVLVTTISIAPNTSVTTIKQNPVNGYVYFSGSTLLCPFGVIRNTDFAVLEPNLQIGQAEGLVFDSSGLAYVALPYGAGFEVAMIDYIDSDISNQTTLSGGVNEVTVEIPPILQEASDVCTDSDTIEKYQQYLNKECKNCT